MKIRLFDTVSKAIILALAISNPLIADEDCDENNFLERCLIYQDYHDKFCGDSADKPLPEECADVASDDYDYYEKFCGENADEPHPKECADIELENDREEYDRDIDSETLLLLSDARLKFISQICHFPPRDDYVHEKMSLMHDSLNKLYDEVVWVLNVFRYQNIPSGVSLGLAEKRDILGEVMGPFNRDMEDGEANPRALDPETMRFSFAHFYSYYYQLERSSVFPEPESGESRADRVASYVGDRHWLGTILNAYKCIGSISETQQ